MWPAPGTVLITCGLLGSASTFRRMRGDAVVNAAIEGFPVAVRRQVEPLVAAQDAVGMLGKGLQQVEFDAGQRNLIALGVKQFVGVEVEAQFPEWDFPLGQFRSLNGTELGSRLSNSRQRAKNGVLRPFTSTTSPVGCSQRAPV